MSSALLLCFLSVLPNQLDRFQLILPRHSQNYFSSYQNSNFSQTLKPAGQNLNCRIDARDYRPLTRHFRIIPDADFIDSLSAETAETTRQLLAGSADLSEYIRSCSQFVKRKLRYDETADSMDPDTILQRGEANCIGYCALFGLFLRAGSISSRVTRGFFLSSDAAGHVLLTPHRWLEITLNAREKIFFDPQVQSFSASYIKADDNIEFTKIKRFAGRLVKRSQRLSNQEEP